MSQLCCSVITASVCVCVCVCVSVCVCVCVSVSVCLCVFYRYCCRLFVLVDGSFYFTVSLLTACFDCHSTVHICELPKPESPCYSGLQNEVQNAPAIDANTPCLNFLTEVLSYCSYRNLTYTRAMCEEQCGKLQSHWY